MTDRTSLGHWVRRFLLEYAASERNLSPNTRASYRDMLVLLLPYVAKSKGAAVDTLAVTDLSAEVVRAFLAHLESERQCSTATRNQRLGSIHALARFIGAHSPQHVEWCAQIRMVPIKKGVAASVTYLEKPEIDALLAAPNRSSSQGARDHALLLFLYNSGARVSEAASLRIGDIDWHARSVRIMGKGSKERRCPLWANTIEHLRRLADKRPHDAHVFLNRRGEPITRYGIHTMVERYVAKLRATSPLLRGKRISPHVLRHSTAMELLQSGVDQSVIALWLGHESVETTQVYIHADLRLKEQALARVAAPASLPGRYRPDDKLLAFLEAL